MTDLRQEQVADAAADLTAAERVAAAVRAEILAGTISPGTRIKQEELAARIGASRLPVREALRMLETEGLVQTEVNKGARVPALNRDEVDILYRMRESLEPLALTESIKNLDVHAIAAIRDLERQIQACPDVAQFLDLDRRFHLLTYSGCASAQLLRTVTQLWNSTQHYRRAFMTRTGEDRRTIVNAEHRLIVDAIERRDREDCERYLSGHIRRTRIELAAHPEIFAAPLA